ncbi:uncharacterized protein N7483_005743 [Penicillium malachiteum]|uniref:uncharacterized protein n=1 Tax=Penicillium malachiteum TaxID=1324776 RepID=UPI0025498004|nr:uncharacterized protein N7483_005743 [Penicillium malachiteum]KAJ5731235.1 hypothetical protein N7483_005743 [Penicillium malachiteum]
MLLNAETALSTSKVLLVPYSSWHVPRYHEWMQDEEIQEATASEPLTLEEEYSMQRSWRQDADKLTFIACRPISQDQTKESGFQVTPEDEAAERMVGDINLFLRVDDGDEGDEIPQLVGELELMIAEKINQRKGFGKASLLAFMRYVVERQTEILDEFVQGSDVSVEQREKLVQSAAATGGVMRFQCLSVKIGQANVRSLALFESLGFVKVTEEPSFFGEFELRKMDLGLEGIVKSLDAAGVEGYVQLHYGRKE